MIEKSMEICQGIYLWLDREEWYHIDFEFSYFPFAIVALRYILEKRVYKETN